MRIRQVLNSLTFRFIARYVTGLVASVFCLQMLLYTYFSYNYFNDLGDDLREELETLQLVYRGQSLSGLQQYISDQDGTPMGARFSYLLTDASGARLAGDLPETPRYREFTGGWFSFQRSLWKQRLVETDAEYLALSSDLGNGVQALVGFNFAAASESGALVFDTLLRAMIATLILGIIGGFFTASFALRRLEDFSQRLARIVRGKVTERMPVEGEKGYLRELSQVTNSMLDQMLLLMQGVKQVSDNIAHDLRTPLTRIRNNLNQLRAGLAPEGQESVDKIIEDCDDLLSTFNALLRISTLESGSRAARDSELDLAELLGDVVELYEPLANDKGVGLALQVPGTWLILGDNDLLFQMFANLVDNAIKYTPAGGDITVRGRVTAEGGNRVEVADSGPGIPAGDRDNVFRRFYRLEASRGKERGHGLGLSLVRAIAVFHHGSVRLEDNRPGLKVVVELP